MSTKFERVNLRCMTRSLQSSPLDCSRTRVGDSKLTHPVVLHNVTWANSCQFPCHSSPRHFAVDATPPNQARGRFEKCAYLFQSVVRQIPAVTGPGGRFRLKKDM